MKYVSILRLCYVDEVGLSHLIAQNISNVRGLYGYATLGCKPLTLLFVLAGQTVERLRVKVVNSYVY